MSMPENIREAKVGSHAFSGWEGKYKKRNLKKLTPKQAFEIFSELYELINLEPETLKKMRMKRIEHIVEIKERLAKLEASE